MISTLFNHTNISTLTISERDRKIPSDALREILSSHVQKLSMLFCRIPSDHLDERDLLSLQAESARLDTLTIDQVIIKSGDDLVMKAFGSSLERIVNLRIGSLTSSDSIHQTDEIFARLARDHLSKNKILSQIDLRGSEIDLVASSSRRNLPINFGGELRRWARRLRAVAFESDVNVCKVLRILNRQCLLLRTICLSPQDYRALSESFDFTSSISSSQESSTQPPIEPLPKLKYLCLCGHFKVTDSILKNILKATAGLKYLNVSGCAVNFEQYWNHLPSTLEELIIDQCSRSQFLKENRFFIRKTFHKCHNLKIYVSMPRFEGEDLESLRGLALLNGADNVLSDKRSVNFHDSFEDDNLIGFELKVKELAEKSSCINIF